MKFYTKKQLKRLRIALIFESNKRTRYIVKHKIFKHTGDNFFFQPRIVPINAEYIKIHNNVAVATKVTFICHDVMQMARSESHPRHGRGQSCCQGQYEECRQVGFRPLEEVHGDWLQWQCSWNRRIKIYNIWG